MLLVCSIFAATPVYGDHISSDVVRDIKGNPIKAGELYYIRVYRSDGSGEFWLSVDDATHNTLGLTTNFQRANNFLFRSEGDSLHTDGKFRYTLAVNDAKESFPFGYEHGGFSIDTPKDLTLFGFWRITGKKVYRYLLTCNIGAIKADFENKKITQKATNETFLISFLEVRGSKNT